jgi:hypothetical protein
MSPSPTSRPIWLALLALTLATLALRLWGSDFGVPMWEEPDPDIPGHVDLLRGDPVLARVTEPEQQYPHLIARVVGLLPGRPPLSGDGAPTNLDEHLRAAAWTHVQVRRTIAVLSALLVPLTFLLARWFACARWALFAAALVATSLLHQSFSQQARPHGAAATFFAWALLANVRLSQRGGWREFAHAGIASALTLGVLQSGLAVLLAGAAAAGIAIAQRRASWLQLLAPIALVAASLPLFYPFYFDGSAGVQDPARIVEVGALRTAEHAISLEEFNGRGFGVLAKSLWNYEPLLCALLVVAAAVALGKWRPQRASNAAWVVLAFAAPYSLVCGLYGMTYERFALPLLPVLAVFVAWNLASLSIANDPLRRGLTALAFLALALPGTAVAKLAYLRAQPDTLDLAASWIEREAPSSTVWIAPPLDLPVLRTPQGLALAGRAPKLGEGFTPWTSWQTYISARRDETVELRWLIPRPAQRSDLDAYLRSLGPGLVLIEVYEQRTEHMLLVSLREALGACAERVARFSPDADPYATELELFFQLSDHFNSDPHLRHPHFTARLLRARAIGRVLELWRLPEAASGN